VTFEKEPRAPLTIAIETGRASTAWTPPDERALARDRVLFFAARRARRRTAVRSR
jgi:hypothetical protein